MNDSSYIKHSKHAKHSIKNEIDLRPVKWAHLKKLVAAGLLKNSAFETIITHSENVNPEQLIKNMAKVDNISCYFKSFKLVSF